MVPITLGVQYYFNGNDITPYILVELNYINGSYKYNFKSIESNKNLPFPPSNNNFIVNSKKFSSVAFSGGVGLQKKITDNFSIDFSTVVVLYSKDNELFHGRLFVGFNYTL